MWLELLCSSFFNVKEIALKGINVHKDINKNSNKNVKKDTHKEVGDSKKTNVEIKSNNESAKSEIETKKPNNVTPEELKRKVDEMLRNNSSDVNADKIEKEEIIHEEPKLVEAQPQNTENKVLDNVQNADLEKDEIK